ncbi:RTA1-domain-containing protein [Aspergillus steynii IBT 23096]|uniref:RTA1-domain-containing protein n=1 Tax=Aspergillus steynii IBT 23096 TaxID=1392250 RepID=A0A2I2GFR4_9EURO|nr:RTA1-domain-containing protein [Aspergillus steynii IBT 23096]PLB51728.1 RTA1-domain-containing protein [Aspergillus steynii IBT 23096]
MPQLETHNVTYIWPYLPSFVAGVIFASLFAIGTIVHCWRMTGTNGKFCFWFILGYLYRRFAIRTIAHHHSGRIWPYIVQTLLILLAPALLAASIYASLKRVIVNLKARELFMLPPRCTTGFFVSGDVASFFIQAVVGSMLSSTTASASTKRTGKTVMIIELLVQVVFLSGSITATAVFHRRWSSSYSSRDLSESLRHWIKVLYCLYAVGLLILVRSVFRVVEYVEGAVGYLLTHEWPLYVLDAAPMVLVMVVFAIWYPVARRRRDFTSIHSTQSLQCISSAV